jgi:ankyrin repeat protein
MPLRSGRFHFAWRESRALHLAAAKGNGYICRQILQRDWVNVNVNDANGGTPLFYALQNGHSDVVKLIWDRLDNLPHQPDNSALAATAKAAFDLARIVMAPETQLDSSERPVALRSAFLTGNPHIITDRFSQVDLSQKDAEGETVLHQAMRGNASGLSALLELEELDVNCKTFAGDSPLHIGAIGGFVENTEILLGHSAVDTCLVDKDGLTALHKASMLGNLEIVNLLANPKNLNVNLWATKCHQGLTALDYAQSYGFESIVARLQSCTMRPIIMDLIGSNSPLLIGA